MILDDTKGIVPQTGTFIALRKSNTPFALTGSRYMCCARPDSDWDFIAQDDVDTILFLRDLGFIDMLTVRNGEYPGGHHSTTSVWEHVDDVSGDTIQVQLTHNLSTKRVVRDVIFAHLSEEHLKADSFERTALWRSLYDCLSFKAYQRLLDTSLPF
jgi:hypothetical protein